MRNEAPITAADEGSRATPAGPRSTPTAFVRPTPDEQRRRARRTALWVGAVALLVYVGFILSGVIGR
jgi:hypothetical protein